MPRTYLLLTIAISCSLAHAGAVQVQIAGEVEYNQINIGALGNVDPGEPALITFELDSADFIDSTNFPTRGYIIDPASFSLTFATVSVGLQNPFPPGQSPLFVLRNNDPAVDGFFLSTDVDGPSGPPLNQQGIFGPFTAEFSVGYTGDTLKSLDILDAAGVYGFGGLTSFLFVVADASFKPLGMIFESLTITPIAPECPGDLNRSGQTDAADLALLLGAWNTPNQDLNGDNTTNAADLALLLGDWGRCAA